jgi:hypothetical protein
MQRLAQSSIKDWRSHPFTTLPGLPSADLVNQFVPFTEAFESFVSDFFLFLQAEFDYQHKKQSGGQGQYGRVMGYIEPTDTIMDEPDFDNHMIGNVITPSWLAAIEKGFRETCLNGPLMDHRMSGVR